MTKYVGCADIPGVCLKYYVLGNRKSGYSVRITEPDVEISCQYVSRNLLKTLDFANRLREGAVFPCNLSEIMEDLKYQASSD